jgi:L-ascorbate metabolism protein UlaG (beta-lactamase superfamily)
MPTYTGSMMALLHDSRQLFAVLACACCVTACVTVGTDVRSDHYDGNRFFNRGPHHTFRDMARWLWEMKTVEWPEWVDDPPQPAPPKRVENGYMRVTYVNHATVLIQMDGLNILTDPIWSTRASPVSWAGPKRVRAPGVKMDDLPTIDLVLISHDHYDHLDLPTLKALQRRDRPMILAGLGVGSHLSRAIFTRVHEMDWWEEVRVGGETVVFVPAVHQSGRLPFLENRTLWGGFVIEGNAGRVYFAGDTGYGSFLEEMHNRYDGFSLTILPLGNYEKRWFMKNQHMNPDDAVKAHLLLNSRQSLGVHFGTFREHPEQSIDAHERDLAGALGRCSLPSGQFWLLEFGEGRAVGPIRDAP